MLNADLGLIQSWSISPTLDKLALVDQSGNVHVADLLRYCNVFPGVLSQAGVPNKWSAAKTSQTWKGQKVYLETCNYGDIPWRNKLVGVHESELERRSRVPAHPVTSQMSRNVHDPSNLVQDKKRSGRARVTGFMTKHEHKKEPVPQKGSEIVVPAPEGVEGYSVERLCLDEGLVSVVYLYNDQHVLCQCEIEDQTWTEVRYCSF